VKTLLNMFPKMHEQGVPGKLLLSVGAKALESVRRAGERTIIGELVCVSTEFTKIEGARNAFL
jgi:hypothetical protein